VFHLPVERKYMRIKMLVTKTVETTPGSFTQFIAGELYLIPESIAKQWIEEGSAIDPTKESNEENVEGGN
jgi:hypothetical protein